MFLLPLSAATSPVYLSPGFNQGCGFYVDKEPGDYICTMVSRHASLVRNMFLLPLSAANISCLPFSRLQPWVQFLIGGRGEGAWRIHLYHGELTCLPCRNMFLPLSAATISCFPFSRLQPGVQFLLGVRGEGAWRLNLYHGELTC